MSVAHQLARLVRADAAGHARPRPVCATLAHLHVLRQDTPRGGRRRTRERTRTRDERSYTTTEAMPMARIGERRDGRRLASGSAARRASASRRRDRASPARSCASGLLDVRPHRVPLAHPRRPQRLSPPRRPRAVPQPRGADRRPRRARPRHGRPAPRRARRGRRGRLRPRRRRPTDGWPPSGRVCAVPVPLDEIAKRSRRHQIMRNTVALGAVARPLRLPARRLDRLAARAVRAQVARDRRAERRGRHARATRTRREHAVRLPAHARAASRARPSASSSTATRRSASARSPPASASTPRTR